MIILTQTEPLLCKQNARAGSLTPLCCARFRLETSLTGEKLPVEATANTKWVNGSHLKKKKKKSTTVCWCSGDFMIVSYMSSLLVDYVISHGRSVLHGRSGETQPETLRMVDRRKKQVTHVSYIDAKLLALFQNLPESPSGYFHAESSLPSLYCILHL